MVTSFISRWSKRKLEETATELLKPEQETQQVAHTAHDEVDSLDTAEETGQESQTEALESQGLEDAVEASNDQVKSEPTSIATLLASEAERSVKKAALRKLFLSDEYNVRDGLDDYDDDYSNLKTLSQSVAETLRDWVKEKQEEPVEETEIAAESNETAVEQTSQVDGVEEQAEQASLSDGTNDSDLSNDELSIANHDEDDSLVSDKQSSETKYTTR
ncbi:DUF3306 domain-containing protein [Vibrio taketomensis]|uniref:DUF3306 domain-containing protein n=1 Tax=Vibrio taketomensis TaxID=2572923 RepID=UPI00138995AF|nr:DUF3306 domain-containing protein [Vibrio taketomensis]